MKQGLAVLLLILGCGCSQNPPQPRTYNQRIETTVENGEVVEVKVVWPGTGCNTHAKNYADMDMLIASIRVMLEELEHIRQSMPEGESDPPPPVIEPNVEPENGSLGNGS